MEKRCCTCKLVKPCADFYKCRTKKDGLQPYCKECGKRWVNDWYTKNSKARGIQNKKWWRKKRAWFKKLLADAKNKPCMDCKTKFPPCVMDFDHRPGTTKLFEIGAGGVGKREELVLAEMAKCDVVCANCHRIRTHIKRKASSSDSKVH